MGWTVFDRTPKGGMEAAVLASISWSGKRPIVASARRGGEVYAAVQVDDKVVGVVGLIEGNGYKTLSEDEGPYYFGAPAEVLEKLSPTQSPYALKWRERCAARGAQ